MVQWGPYLQLQGTPQCVQSVCLDRGMRQACDMPEYHPFHDTKLLPKGIARGHKLLTLHRARQQLRLAWPQARYELQRRLLPG